MKNMLLFLLALIVVPVWAEDVAVAPTTQKSTAMQAAPVAETGVVIELKGSAKSISALVTDLEKEAVYKEAACVTTKTTGEIAKVSCAKADSALMAFMAKNASAKVHWSISGAGTNALQGCPAGCVMMPCPTLNKCCSLTTHKPC
jgi:hypothetical protein